MAKSEVLEIVTSAAKKGSKILLEHDAKRLLHLMGVAVNRTEFAPDVETAVELAKEIKYPVVLKIVSPDIPSKKDVGGVKTGIGSEIELRHAFESIIRSARSASPHAKILGVSVQEHVFYDHEATVRSWRHEKYGPVVMFGLRGIWTDFLGDTSFRLAPLDENDAMGMISETRAYAVLRGLGERHPCDVRALAGAIVKVGELVHEVDEIQEILIDPMLLVREGRGAVAADAKIWLRGS
jgi:acyl-CoA synthetase (NDP forming)